MRPEPEAETVLELEQGGSLAVGPAAGAVGDKPASAYIIFLDEQAVTLTIGEVALLILKLRDCQMQAQGQDNEAA